MKRKVTSSRRVKHPKLVVLAITVLAILATDPDLRLKALSLLERFFLFM